jgi:hypothetical protein
VPPVVAQAIAELVRAHLEEVEAPASLKPKATFVKQLQLLAV